MAKVKTKVFYPKWFWVINEGWNHEMWTTTILLLIYSKWLSDIQEDKECQFLSTFVSCNTHQQHTIKWNWRQTRCLTSCCFAYCFLWASITEPHSIVRLRYRKLTDCFQNPSTLWKQYMKKQERIRDFLAHILCNKIINNSNIKIKH